MRLENYLNILILIITLLGFVIGFINEELRLLVWSLSLALLIILIIILVFRDYIKRIENSELEITQIKKDLNISDRLSKLEGEIEVIKNGKR